MAKSYSSGKKLCGIDSQHHRASSDFTNAKWAVRLCSLYNKHPIHVRRLHYFVLTQESISRPDGKSYTNTMDNYLLLKTACSQAANLGLLPYQIFSTIQQYNQMFICRRESHHLKHQNLNITILETLSEIFARTLIASAMPAHIEIWLENSNATDIVEPIATRFNVNLLARTSEIGVGELWHFLRRISQATRPVRVFYLSDLLSNQNNSIKSIRNQLDKILRKYDLSEKLDIKIESLMLTHTQQQRFKLPSPPIDNCTLDTGRVIAELHALETAGPGYIEDMLSRRLRKYLNDLEISRTKKILMIQLQSVIKKLGNTTDNRSDILTVLNALKTDLTSGNDTI